MPGCQIAADAWYVLVSVYMWGLGRLSQVVAHEEARAKDAAGSGLLSDPSVCLNQRFQISEFGVQCRRGCRGVSRLKLQAAVGFSVFVCVYGQNLLLCQP